MVASFALRPARGSCTPASRGARRCACAPHPAGRVHHLRDPEVEHFSNLPARLAHEEHVLGLEIAVHDALRVRRREPGQDLLQDRDRLLKGTRPPFAV